MTLLCFVQVTFDFDSKHFNYRFKTIENLPIKSKDGNVIFVLTFNTVLRSDLSFDKMTMGNLFSQKVIQIKVHLFIAVKD